MSSEWAPGGAETVDFDVPVDDDPFADDLDAQLAARAPQRWVTRTTVGLAGLVLLVAGFLAGAQVQKHFGPTPAPASSAANARQNAAGARQSTNATRTGTVKLVDGTTIYVATPDGQTVIVRTNGQTAVQTVQPGSLADLVPGTQVSVEGPAAGDGTVTATKVSRTK